MIQPFNWHFRFQCRWEASPTNWGLPPLFFLWQDDYFWQRISPLFCGNASTSGESYYPVTGTSTTPVVSDSVDYILTTFCDYWDMSRRSLQHLDTVSLRTDVGMSGKDWNCGENLFLEESWAEWGLHKQIQMVQLRLELHRGGYLPTGLQKASAVGADWEIVLPRVWRGWTIWTFKRPGGGRNHWTQIQTCGGAAEAVMTA